MELPKETQDELKYDSKTDWRVRGLLECFDRIYEKQKTEKLEFNQVICEVKQNIKAKRNFFKFLKEIFSIIASITFVMLVVGVFFVLLLSVVGKIPAVDRFLARELAFLDYPSRRLFRFAFLPFVKTYGDSMYGLYESDCLVGNPFFTKKYDCNICKSTKEILKLQSLEQTKPNQPFIAVNLGRRFGIEELQAVDKQLDKGRRMLHCSDPRFRTVVDVLKGTSAHFYRSVSLGHTFCFWSTAHVHSSRALRELTGRPPFVLKESEITYNKDVYLAGPRHSITLASKHHFASQFVFLAHGKREIVLKPIGCEKHCQTLSEVLEAGDILYFNQAEYEASLIPSNEQDYTLAVQGSFL